MSDESLPEKLLQMAAKFFQGFGGAPTRSGSSSASNSAEKLKTGARANNSASKSDPPGEVVSDGLVSIKNPNRSNLPKRIKARSLHLTKCEKLEELPILEVRQLTITECGALKELPNNLDLWELEITGAAILKKLPDDLKVQNRLVLRNCTALETLPVNLTVGTLVLAGCSALEALPENLTVDFLDVSDCNSLRTWPQKALVTVGRFSARNCVQLREIPPFVVNVSQVDVSGCSELSSVPETLRVNSWIDIGGTKITSLPESMSNVQIRWRGVPIDERIAFRPETLTSEEILATRNIELRRVMIERMGFERFTAQANAEVLDQDTDAGGKRQLLKVLIEGDEDLVCVSMKCPSTGKQYVVRVPPTTKSCHQAIAWIAGFDDPKKYKPLAET